MSFIPVNRTTGMFALQKASPIPSWRRSNRPGTGPADTLSIIGMDGYAPPEEILRESPQANQAVTSGERPAACSNPLLTIGSGGSALYISAGRNYARGQIFTSFRGREPNACANEIENVVDEIKQAITLLRRHL